MLTGKSVLYWFIKEHEINQQLRKWAIFIVTVGFIIFCTRGTGNTATAASHHSEADSLNKLAELTFDNDSLNVFSVCTLLFGLSQHASCLLRFLDFISIPSAFLLWSSQKINSQTYQHLQNMEGVESSATVFALPDCKAR